jgi:hypothetical protein
MNMEKSPLTQSGPGFTALLATRTRCAEQGDNVPEPWKMLEVEKAAWVQTSQRYKSHETARLQHPEILG